MAGRDYYQILGVPRTSTQDELRRAYRKLARELHPDVNKAPDAQKKFTEVQHAYDVLSDESKRALYDQYGEGFATRGSGGAGTPGGSGAWSTSSARGGGGGVDFDMEDLSSMFDAMFGGRGQASPGTSKRSKSKRGPAQAAPPPEAEPVRHDLHISFMTAARGGTESLQLQHSGGKRTVEVNIPAGIHDGATLRVRNVFGGTSGPDLLLTIRVGGHPAFRRGEGLQTGKGNDLLVDLPLTIAEATLGATVTAPTLEGDVDLTVPPGTASGKRLRLKGKGIRSAGGDVGDLYAVVKIVPPPADALTQAERELLVRLSSRGPSPRATL